VPQLGLLFCIDVYIGYLILEADFKAVFNVYSINNACFFSVLLEFDRPLSCDNWNSFGM